MKTRTLEKIMGKIFSLQAGDIHVSYVLGRVNRREDGYQPSYEGKIVYSLERRWIAEEISAGESDYELDVEAREELSFLEDIIIESGYQVVRSDYHVQFKKNKR